MLFPQSTPLMFIMYSEQQTSEIKYDSELIKTFFNKSYTTGPWNTTMFPISGVKGLFPATV